MDEQTPAQRVFAFFGDSPTKMANAIGGNVIRQNVEHWMKSGRIPSEHGAVVHALTGVTRWELYPETWARMWPELIGTKDAPPVPHKVAA